MKKLIVALCSLIFTTLAQAQWQSTAYTLKGGWNAIYLHGDASYALPSTLFAGYPAVLEIWRWNLNPAQVQFTTSPLIPSAGTAEWSVWKSDGTVNTLSQMVGQTAYLVKCSGTTSNSYSVSIPQKVMPPSAAWVRNGANLMGFPSKLNVSVYPTMSSYFATFPAAIASNVKIYKYVGGDLSPSNPLQLFSPSTEKLDRNQAYWFESKVVGNFYAPVEISLSTGSGLDYGRTGSVVTVRLLNRSSTPSTVTIAPVASNAAPTGQEAISGSVPLTRRVYTAATNTWIETPILSSYTELVGPNAAVELSFGIDRANATMTAAAANALFASQLRFTDSANLYDIQLPATARKASLAGLWIGEAQVNGVQNKAAGYSGTTTSQSYPLRYIIHVDDAGTARVLSQVFLGKLAAEPHDLGICIKESGLYTAEKASASRIVAAHLPLDRVLDGVAKASEPAGSGSFALGGTLTRTISTPFNDPVSPFVHQYHPDHDNKSGSTALVSGQESYDLSRALTFTFAATAPDGTSATGYGSSVIAGTYAETITGLRKDTLTVTGTIALRRVSEIGVLTQ
ncbi:MAG: hypothetical protein ORN51_00885 [Akkermansiaceae bacterium]|nr:hypothetical protein [Akkermansiaceae bacterium]